MLTKNLIINTKIHVQGLGVTIGEDLSEPEPFLPEVADETGPVVERRVFGHDVISALDRSRCLLLDPFDDVVRQTGRCVRDVVDGTLAAVY
jgi:hypothetical protein